MNRSNNKNHKDNSPTDLSADVPVSPNVLMTSQKVENKEHILRVIYAVACFANLVINLDHGILPACTQEIKRDLKIDEFKLGLLGSVVYVGLMLGSITSGPLLQTYSSKKIIAGSTLGNIISLFIFPMTDNFFLLCLSRGLVGFFQVFAVIYFPVWVDTYGREKKTLWITFLQLGVALGVFFGYGLTAIFVQFFTWRISFYTQIALLTPCFLAFAVFDEKYMSTSGANEKEEKGGRASEDGQERYLLTVSHSGSFFGNEIRDYVLANEPGTAGRKSNAQRRDSIEEEEEDVAERLTYLDYMKILWTKKVYIYTMLAISSLYFVITGIQFWISDYLRTVLGQEKDKVFMSFALISITGPTSGVVIGGTILDRLGGYTGKSALDFCLICGTLASLSALPVPFLNHFMTICVLLWLVMFFGGALMPAVIGIMLSSIPKRMRAMGYSAAQIVQNFLGYVPAPVVYGFVVEMTGGEDSRYGMVLLMSWSSLGVFCLFAAKNARIKKHEDYMHKQHLEIGEEDLNKPDLFEPKPKFLEMKALDLETYDDDYIDMDAMTNRKIRHARTRTFGELPPDATTRHKSIIGGKSAKIEKELEALNSATVDYRTLRGQRTSILSSENLGGFNMMFGRATVDKNLKEIEDEML
jgi:MFS family permease